MLASIIWKPTLRMGKLSFQTFWIAPLLGALFALASLQIDFSSIWPSLFSGKMNPIKILVLFISLSMISISLDELNFFNYLSCKALKVSQGSQYKIFFALYFLVALLTVFTSNDIVILSLTPFIISFSKKAKINPIPFLICEFVNANTYSMLLSIGNPTNIYLAGSENVDFVYYLSKMWLPTFLAGLTTLGVILLLFRKDLGKPVEKVELNDTPLKNKSLVIINLIILAATTILLVLSNYIAFEMWLICLSSMILLSFVLLGYSLRLKDGSYLTEPYKRLPYNLIPFILSMFVLVLSLKENGVMALLENSLDTLSINPLAETFSYAISSTLFDNIINNIPMSVLYSSILEGKSELAIFSTIIGSNIGAYLTPIGALAGIMWMSILKKYNVDFNFVSFMKYGLILVPIALVSSVFGLYVLCC